MPVAMKEAAKMKKAIGICLIAATLVVALPQPARAGVWVYQSVAEDSLVVLPPVTTATKVTIQVKGDGSAAMRVLILQRVPPQSSYTTMAEYVNPDAEGKIYEGPGGGLIAVQVLDWSAGAVDVTAEAVSGTTVLF